MNDYIIHIGRHKTGTSSLQRFLHLNRTRLETAGIYYPFCDKKSIAHHNIARHFFGPRALLRFSENEQQLHSAAFQGMLKEVEKRTEKILLSSEGFQNARPNLLMRSISAKSIIIIVYIREQVDYLISAYQQKVHATNYSGSLLEFSESFTVDYDYFIGRWEKSFGRSNIMPRIYSKNELNGGDIVKDFCQILGIHNLNTFTHPNSDQNPSIGGPLLELKRRLNFFTPQHNTDPHLYRAISVLAGDNAIFRLRPELPKDRATEIRSAASASNQRVFERYSNIEQGFEKPDQNNQKKLTKWDLHHQSEAFKKLQILLSDRLPPNKNLLLEFLDYASCQSGINANINNNLELSNDFLDINNYAS
jgi:hypothetical protein